MFKLLDINELNEKSYMDLCGKFPYTSSRGAKYILVIYDHDSNLIEGITLKSRNASEITDKWQQLYSKITKNNVQTKYSILDNEASKLLKDALVNHKQDYQLTPPHMHRINAAERAIRTYKNHLVAGLATCNKDFPITKWDRIINQANITLHLLRNARANPGLSAYAYAYGEYNFQKTPLCPPGTKAVIHLKPGNRGSWQFHGKDGWTVGPLLEHYRCIRCYMPDTGKEIDADTLSLIPRHIPIPTASLDEHLKQAATTLITLLKQKRKPLPGPQLNQSTLDGIQQLADIFLDNNFQIESQSQHIPQQHTLPMQTIPAKPIAPKTTLPTKAPKHKKLTDEEFQAILKNIPKNRIHAPTKPSPSPLAYFKKTEGVSPQLQNPI